MLFFFFVIKELSQIYNSPWFHIIFFVNLSFFFSFFVSCVHVLTWLIFTRFQFFLIFCAAAVVAMLLSCSFIKLKRSLLHVNAMKCKNSIFRFFSFFSDCSWLPVTVCLKVLQDQKMLRKWAESSVCYCITCNTWLWLSLQIF